jgi:hypothetical protein
MIRRAALPDDFTEEREAVRAAIEGMADDPLMKAVIVFEAVPGTVEAFRAIRARRPDILLFAAESHGPAALIAKEADLVVNADFISRGYLVPWTARAMGARAIVHVSFPRHLAIEAVQRRMTIMEVACRDLGLRFGSEEAPDPTGEGGIDRAKAAVEKSMPLWLSKYGKDTAFFPTNNAHTGPIIKGVLAHGGYFPEGDEPSPLLGYPEALGLDTDALQGDWPEVLRAVEAAAVAAGGSGRLGAWPVSLAYSHLTALPRHAVRAVRGEAAATDVARLLESYGESAPGARFSGAPLQEPAGRVYPNMLLVYQDTYVFGKGYAGSTSQRVPAKYGRISAGNPGGLASAPFRAPSPSASPATPAPGSGGR